MARIDERTPDGTPGDWFIDERCIGCGSSASVAPELIVRRGSTYVFDHQPDGDDEIDRAWLARELCPTRSIGTETRTPKRDPYPHPEAPGVYRCGHNDLPRALARPRVPRRPTRRAGPPRCRGAPRPSLPGDRDSFVVGLSCNTWVGDGYDRGHYTPSFRRVTVPTGVGAAGSGRPG